MPRNRGFTLLEMIIALGIFTVIWAISYGGLNRFIDQRDDITARHEEIKSLQVVFALLAQDMQYMANRSVRDGFGDKEASVVSEGHISIPETELVRFTTAQPDPNLDPAQRMKRVAWRLEDGVLSRVSWLVLDRDQDSVEHERKLLEGVAQVNVEYLTYANDSEELVSVEEWEQQDELPAGVEIRLTVDKGLEYRRLFAVAGGI